jgi:hypothetical protein
MPRHQWAVEHLSNLTTARRRKQHTHHTSPAPPIGATRRQCTLARPSAAATTPSAVCNAASGADWQVMELAALPSYLRPSTNNSPAPASGSFAYQTGDAAGTKFASRDLSGPTTTLALVSKAGTRFQTLPGLTEGLEKFAFRVRRPFLNTPCFFLGCYFGVM